jgi:hypothetical protein
MKLLIISKLEYKFFVKKIIIHFVNVTVGYGSKDLVGFFQCNWLGALQVVIFSGLMVGIMFFKMPFFSSSL